MKLTSLIYPFIVMTVLSGQARAADLDTIIPAQSEDPYVPVEVGSGWYIRGDVSYDLATSTTGNYRTYSLVAPAPAAPVFNYNTNAYDQIKFVSGKTISAGFGYQLNAFVRGDLTVGSWSRLVNGRDKSVGVCVAGAPAGATDCRSEETGKAAAWELMANGYADLGTYVGITPYLGAGAGFTHVSYKDITSRDFCTDAAGADVLGGTCTFAPAVHSGLGSYRLTMALMAGASYDISQNTKFDLGYRYTRVAGGNMYNFDAASIAAGASGPQGTDKGFSTHEIKAGFRYEIW